MFPHSNCYFFFKNIFSSDQSYTIRCTFLFRSLFFKFLLFISEHLRIAFGSISLNFSLISWKTSLQSLKEEQQDYGHLFVFYIITRLSFQIIVRKLISKCWRSDFPPLAFCILRCQQIQNQRGMFNFLETLMVNTDSIPSITSCIQHGELEW